MSETSPSSVSDSTGISPPADLLVRPPIKRARPQLSCVPCRQGKLKCSREHPVCDQCAKRSRHEACQYVPPPARNKQAQNMRGRIRNLENMVVNLINQKAQEQVPIESSVAEHNAPAPKEPEEPSAESFGMLRISHTGNETNYVGAGHWSSLLKEIEEVKDSLDEDDGADEFSEDVWDEMDNRSTVTFGVPRPVTKSILIQEMPPKEEVDRLLPLWFNSSDPLLFVIHKQTFQEEYNQFYRDPSTTPVMWIALLYSAMALGIILGPRNPGMTVRSGQRLLDDNNDNLTKAANKFQQLASSAIVLADISKSQPYTLETMMIYGECEFLRRNDRHAKIWLMNGVTLRVAMRMGYHRDPSKFKGFTPFQAEMRRRVWHVLNMMDTLISFSIGLPTTLRRVESDVKVPANLFDYDISADMTELPKSRPDTTVTPASYSIAKSRICAIFGEAAEQSQMIVPPRHSTIMALDKKLTEAHEAIPVAMRVRPMEDSITDPPVLIMSRFNIEVLYQKTRLVLHRYFLTAGQSNPRFSESRKTCVDAAKMLLHYQNIIFHACAPGGQLNKVWWYMSSLTTFDFLLGAMVICLDLNHLQSKEPTSPQIEEYTTILENTYNIWTHNPNRFKESSKGAEMLKAMLKKCADQREAQATSQASTTAESEQDYTSQPATEPTPETLPGEGTQVWGVWPPQAPVPSFDMADIPSEIDWTAWDSAMQGQTNVLPQQTWASNNDPMTTWLGMTGPVDNMLGVMGNTNTFHDFSDPLNIYSATGYVQIDQGDLEG
ncbi:hypothetical protein P154DRAFT_454391 [Amniculicola lignicola CBS 123094]|uniref:Zn(2)-C6 fungal-type domain-containing protein n=1 Tax=Amniculicola lignicola CBS 123094 TaxID=1392246 RepID=A0A6A5X3P3_9PLEO|nr:hypothetical protein P154DRAFT_454391 [Amniculicola lignicola CBS 123094]